MHVRRRTALFVAALVVSGLAFGVFVPPGGAQANTSFTVEKVVDGEASPPPDAEFVVTVVCTGEGDATFEISFDAQGVPVPSDSNTVVPGFIGSCTFTETQTADASAVAYACTVSNDIDGECSGGGADPVTITYSASAQFTGTVTVTNTYDPPPPPPPVVLQPVFTG